MKNYTDLPQSKKLAEFLPLESADHFHIIGHLHTDGPRYEVIRTRNEVVETDKYWPCWSLAALLDVIPFPSLHKTFLGYRCDSYNKEGTTCKFGESTDNPIDSCYEMILKLHEQKLL